MEFIFFGSDNKLVFARRDAEQAEWTVHEMGLHLLFPYDSNKVIERGQRVGFYDDSSVFQMFEIRRAKTYEPDHYQEIEAEHIAISELTDEFYEGHDFDSVTASSALTTLLTGTLWSVGTNTASGTSSLHLGFSDKWSDVRQIESNWNVTITPRITFAATGITGRYLDIAPADGTFQGLRLSLEKNIDDVGVQWDDSNVKTALYGFGASVETTVNNETVRQPLTFASVTWTATSEHPAKPSGQKYIEDPDATTAYGRNGRARFGWYQNADIDNANTLLQKTWEALKVQRVPDVTIDCNVLDLKRYGYVDVSIHLGDLAQVEVKPTNVILLKQVTCLTVDLLDPSKTRVTIGAYVPNIVYIAEQTNKKATGGGGGGGGGGQDNKEYEWQEFIKFIGVEDDKLQIYERQVNRLNEIMRQAGISIDVDTGVIIYYTDNVNMLQSKINVQADRISLVVEGTGTNAHIKPASIVASINDSGSSIKISATHIDIDGLVTALETMELSCANIYVGTQADVGHLITTTYADIGTNVEAGGYIEADSYIKAGSYVEATTGFLTGGSTATWQSQEVVTGITVTKTGQKTWSLDGGGTYTASLVEYVTYNHTTLSYLGA